MNDKQLVTLAVAILLLAAIFVFPFTKYQVITELPPGAQPSVRLEGLSDANLRQLKFETHESFQPFWKNSDAAFLNEDGRMEFGVSTRWSRVLALAAAVLFVSGLALFMLRIRKQQLPYD